MIPYFNIFGKDLSSYGVLVLIGVFVCGIFVCRQAKKRGYNDNDFIIFMLISAIGIMLGGHLLYGITKINSIIELLTHWSKYVTSFESFIACMGVIFGGSVFYGGLLGGIAAGIIYGKCKKLDMSVYSDIVAPAVPLFHCFGRIGCFLGGCCYGIESEFGFTAHGNELVPSINDVNRFPVQLLEASCNLAIFFVLWYLLSKGKLKGRLFALYLTIYPIVRFCDEFLRGDEYRGFLFGLSTSQIISILVFIGAVTFLITKTIKIKKSNVTSTE